MKALSAVLAAAILVTSVFSIGAAREAAKPGLRVVRESAEDRAPGLAEPGMSVLYEEAAVDTYCLVWYDFESMNWQGWTRVDETAQRDTFFHVEDFAGLEGYAALEGTKSMWCGARPDPADPYACSWAAAPGYGNNWDQSLRMGPLPPVGALTLSYKIAYDVEPGYDYVRVEYEGTDGWEAVAEYSGEGDTTVSLFLPVTVAWTKLRFHFTSDGAWSDEDGRYDSDGACVVDSIRLADAMSSVYEDFESTAVGETHGKRWRGVPGESFGMYSGLAHSLIDKDPCGDDFASLIVFFIGSGVPSTSYPGLYDTPFCKGADGHEAPCQNELVASPLIDTRKYSTGLNSVQDGVIPPGELPSLGGFLLRFSVYDDLPWSNCVFYQWHVRNVVNGCPGPWLDRNILIWTGEQYWISSMQAVGDLLASDTVQIALGVVDMCDAWYLVSGNCAQHTPAPWYDDVRLYRYYDAGPQWSCRDLDLFQDNFPAQEFVIESYVRADAANDINTNDDPVIRPGDSIVIDCASPRGGGIGADPSHGGPAVYLHVKAVCVGPDSLTKPPLAGPALAGSVLAGPAGSQHTIDFNYVSDDGLWTVVQCDTARTAAGIVKSRYMVDLNDELFTRGYEIEYYFTARDSAGAEASYPKNARIRGLFFEWTCLPTQNSQVLFVDDSRASLLRAYRGSSAREYWDLAWDALIDSDPPDRYDVNSPSSGVSNGPGSRAKTYQLANQYNVIIWDCGWYESVTITDGTVNSDKSNDCRMLIDWIEQSERHVGLWICGDDVAFDLDQMSSTPALTLMGTWCGVDYVATSYFHETGGITGGGVVYPLVKGDAEAGIFIHAAVPDSFYVEGGCPFLSQFDVLGKALYGEYALRYPDYGGLPRYAGIASSQLNPAGYNVNTLWFGFSFQYIRDAAPDARLIRKHLAMDAFDFLGAGACNWPGCDERTPAGVSAVYRLAQNYPNPFNPSTTIRFEMREKGLVTVKVYNVAGQLVRTLADGVREAGPHALLWDGTNNTGADVASGIYFYKMEAPSFSATKKLVLLR